MPTDDFYRVLTAAVDDMIANGFDSVERVAKWTAELRAAALRSLVSPVTMEQMLNEALASIYKKMIEQGGIARYNPGVERFTLERVKPQLRAELDRRIVASASLIRLNREQAIEKTIQRFQGWSTSIPKGGTEVARRRDTKDNVRKSLASLPFEERRVLIDQGHKLTGALSQILAVDGGAIAGIWHSHWRQAGYNYRVDHKERDLLVYAVRDSWAIKLGLMKVGPAGYYDKVTAVGEEPFCRCFMQWIYAIRDLPSDMLTRKGEAELARVRKEIAA